jgi:sarcosine oxidase subunit beta
MSIVIVGGGVIGCSIAYNLAKLGTKDVTIVEKDIPNHGTSTRSASRFRVHFWTEENVRFATESRRIFLNLASATKWNPIISIGGYLWLLPNEKHLKAFEKANQMWARLGVAGTFFSPEETREQYPYLNTDGFVQAFFGPQDGSLHHDYVTYGYYMASKAMGVRCVEHAEATKITLEDGKVTGVETDQGPVKGEKVILAAGAWTADLARTVGIELPMEPVKKEILITEPFRFFLEPFIVDNGTSGYFGQTLRGEILGGIDVPVEKGLRPLNTSILCAKEWAKTVTRVVPAMKYARAFRGWSGYFDPTSDGSHILGSDPEWPRGLHVAAGFGGHGFLMAPLTGEVMARYVAFEEIPELMEPFLPTRFKEGRLVNETLVVG